MEQYRDVSVRLINSLKNDGDDGELLIEEREKLLGYLKRTEFSKNDLIAIADELDLVEIEKQVTEAISKVRNLLKEEISELNIKRNANRSYGNNFSSISFINKKI